MKDQLIEKYQYLSNNTMDALERDGYNYVVELLEGKCRFSLDQTIEDWYKLKDRGDEKEKEENTWFYNLLLQVKEELGDA